MRRETLAVRKKPSLQKDGQARERSSERSGGRRTLGLIRVPLKLGKEEGWRGRDRQNWRRSLTVRNGLVEDDQGPKLYLSEVPFNGDPAKTRGKKKEY